MLKTAQLFIDKLKENDFVFQSSDMESGGIRVIFPYEGKGVFFFFDNDDKHVALRMAYKPCPPERIPDMLIVCNGLNDEYKWLKFYIDRNNYIVVADDAILDSETAADECFELLTNLVGILEDVGPVLDRGLED